MADSSATLAGPSRKDECSTAARQPLTSGTDGPPVDGFHSLAHKIYSSGGLADGIQWGSGARGHCSKSRGQQRRRP
jgi:hypothetical protein